MNNHLSVEQLNDMVEAAKAQIPVGARFVHYKGGEYTVTGIAIWEATDEVVVVYYADNAPNVTFVRPVSVWFEEVEWHGKTVPRFSRVP